VIVLIGGALATFDSGLTTRQAVSVPDAPQVIYPAESTLGVSPSDRWPRHAESASAALTSTAITGSRSPRWCTRPACRPWRPPRRYQEAIKVASVNSCLSDSMQCEHRGALQRSSRRARRQSIRSAPD